MISVLDPVSQGGPGRRGITRDLSRRGATGLGLGGLALLALVLVSGGARDGPASQAAPANPVARRPSAPAAAEEVVAPVVEGAAAAAARAARAAIAAGILPPPSALTVPDSTGFHPAVLTRTVVAHLDKPHPKTKRREARVRAGTRVELLAPPPFLEGRPWCLLPDDQVAWVPADSIEMLPEEDLASADELARLPGREVDEAPFCLYPGLRHRRLRWRGARLQLVEANFDENPQLQPALAVADYFGVSPGKGTRTAPVSKYSSRHEALLAVNGTFFSTGSKNWGTPLGALVQGGRLLNAEEAPAALLRNRSFLAWTSRGRLITGELDEPAKVVLARNRRDAFRPEVFRPGERIVHLFGGLGRLVREGDREAWRLVHARQFPAYYYGRRTRRAQVVFGVDATGRRLYVLAQEGYPHSKHRLTLPELGHLVAGLGAHDVVFGDGGRSTDMVLLGQELVRGESNKPKRQVSSAFMVREAPREARGD